MNPVEAARTILRNLERKPSANETSRRELLIGHLSSLFPKYSWQIAQYALGAERLVRSTSSLIIGRIDTRKGALLIEYKKSVRTLSEQKDAEDQLREYIAGLANEEGKNSIGKCISTDILRWHEYEVDFAKNASVGNIQPSGVILSSKRSYAFSSNAPEIFVDVVERLIFEEVPLVANSEILVDMFGLDSQFYNEFRKVLEQVWIEIKKTPEAQLGLRLWSQFVENCFDQTARPDEANYLDHVYLVIIARMIAGFAVTTKEEQTQTGFARGCVSGDFFASGPHRVEKFVEEDFFRWIKTEKALTSLDQDLEKLHRKLEWLDFRSAKKLNLLAELYAEIMPSQWRAEYGGVFTPSWLVDKIVDNLKDCEQEGIRFLDPACGTGSFLRAVVLKKLKNLSGKYGSQEILEKALGDICGLDINPVSVIISKTTLMLTLADLLRESDKPIEIPVYLCDSLFLPKRVVAPQVDEKVQISFDKATIYFPARIFEEETMIFDQIVESASSLATDVASNIIPLKDGKCTLERQINGIAEIFRPTSNERDLLRKAAANLLDILVERILERRNKIWAFVLKNTYRPSLLQAQFHLIASNPPWLAMSSFPAARYKRQLESQIEKYGLTPAGQSKHHMEIATLFAIHSATHYLKTGGSFAFVLPRVILNGDQHDPLRKSKFLDMAPITMSHLWDFIDVEPLFKRPACVLFGFTSENPTGFPQELSSSEFRGNPFEKMEVRERTLKLTTLGQKSSYSDSEHGYTEATIRYLAGFRQGADLMPRCAVIVDIQGRRDATILSIQTAQAERTNLKNKPPWNDIELYGTIERQYIFNTVKSVAVLPFTAGNPAHVALPVRIRNGSFEILDINQIALMGHSHAKKWFQKMNKVLTRVGGKKLSSWLKRRNKLVNQSAEPCDSLVVYGAGGKNVCSTVLNTSTMEFPFINDQTLYSWRAPSKVEAWYVCGMLNSVIINERIKGKQPKGLFGEQHIHKLPLVLIPRFDPGRFEHVALAKEAERLSVVADKLVASNSRYLDETKSLSSRRRPFLEELKGEMLEFNEIAQKILEVANTE